MLVYTGGCTLFAEAPTNALSIRFCFSALTNISICQRCLRVAAKVWAMDLWRLVRNSSMSPMYSRAVSTRHSRCQHLPSDPVPVSWIV